ncbi:MAG: NADP-dependent oxidoreductase [Halobacteriales archaeon]
MAGTNRRYVLAKRPEGTPDLDTFALEETEIPTPADNEVLVRTRYLSVDPYMRGRMADRESYADPWAVGDPLRGHAVGEVVASEHDRWGAGDLVHGRLLWADYAVADGRDLTRVDPEVAPLPAYLGVLGMPGRTAYFGTLEVADPSPGETVVVSGAAGAVGSTAGQIAALAGCRVVGVAGTDEKVRVLEGELGFDAGINYAATDDYRAALDEVAPEGVDVYFDNVGGPITDAVFDRLAVDARVAVCGQIAHYNAEERPTGPRKLGSLIATRARVEGFLVGDFEPRFEAATEQLAAWVRDGTLAHRETVVEGLENAPEAFLGLFEGENVGKQVVEVAGD